MSDCTAARHGTATAYQVDGCRCPDAKEQQRLYRKRLRHEHHAGRARKVDATGTRRRWQALMAIGWTNKALMQSLGYAVCGNWIAYAESIHVDTARRVRDLYDELWDQPGPSKWTRTWALNRGFLPPMAWDDDTIDRPGAAPTPTDGTRVDVDEVVVERLLSGEDWRALGATRPERIEAAELMPTKVEAERRLGLRAGRDFALREAS